MPIAPTPSPERVEAGSAWLLFGETAKVLRKGGDRSERDRLLNNAYRGLQAYDLDPGSVRGLHGLHRTTHDAVDDAFERTAPGVPRDQAFEALVARMRAVVTGEGGAPDDVERIARFCERVRENLDRPVAAS
jgi:hypothetical protein